jgi:hypothetical protein
MKKISFAFCFLFVLTVVSIPASSQAYEVTNQTAVRLNDNTLLFTITSRFSFLNYALDMPVSAMRNTEPELTFPNVGYGLFTNDNKPFTAGETYSVVLSDAQLVGDRYKLATSTAGYFTLVTLVKLPDNYQNTGQEIHLRTTTQPYTIKNQTQEIKSQLTPKQLEPHKTPQIKI